VKRSTAYALAGSWFTALAAVAPAHAQEAPDTFRLGEIVVTATRLPTPIAEAPGAVTVVTGDALRARGVRFVIDALRTVPGVAVAQSAGPGALTSVFMRGGESDYVQVLVDGVQVNDPGGAYNWAHLRADDIDRIEIVRGPASVLYGSDAVSGVIQIFTRSGGAPTVSAAVTGSRGTRPGDATGNFDTHAFDASVTGSTMVANAASLRYGVSAGHTTSTGLYALNSDYDNTTISAKLDVEAGAADVSITGRRVEHDYHYPTSGSGMIVDINQFAKGTALSFGAAAGYRLTNALELRVETTLHDTESRTEDPPDDDEDGSSWNTADLTRRGVDVRANIRLPHGTVLTLGAAREWQHAETGLESISSFGTFTDSTDESRRNTGYYAQLHGTPARAVSVTLGGRIDSNEAFGTFRTARAALGWRPVHALRIHAAVGTAFKEPTFYENYATGFVRGNPDLEPERTRSHEAGVEYAFFGGRLTAGATWFEQEFRNLIQYTASPPVLDTPNYHNVGSARARGAELSLQGGAGPVTLATSYTYTSTRVLDAGFGDDPSFEDGQPLLRRPKHQATAALALAVTREVRALLDVRHSGSRVDLDFTDPAEWSGVRTRIQSFTVLDVGAAVTLLQGGGGGARSAGDSRRARSAGADPRSRGTGLELTAHVRNLLDRRYAEIYNFPAPGRVLQIGVRATL
jgi:vitamin B12 transporter